VRPVDDVAEHLGRRYKVTVVGGRARGGIAVRVNGRFWRAADTLGAMSGAAATVAGLAARIRCARNSQVAWG
jgi:hypothetical protein